MSHYLKILSCGSSKLSPTKEVNGLGLHRWDQCFLKQQWSQWNDRNVHMNVPSPRGALASHTDAMEDDSLELNENKLDKLLANKNQAQPKITGQVFELESLCQWFDRQAVTVSCVSWMETVRTELGPHRFSLSLFLFDWDFVKPSFYQSCVCVPCIPLEQFDSWSVMMPPPPDERGRLCETS